MDVVTGKFPSLKLLFSLVVVESLTLLKTTLTFDSKEDLSSVKDNFYILIPTFLPTLLLKFPNGLPEVFLFSSLLEAVTGRRCRIVVLRIWKNNSKLLKTRQNSWKISVKECLLRHSCFLRFLPDFKYRFFFQNSFQWLLQLLAYVFPYINNRCKNCVHYQSKVISKISDNKVFQ